MNHANDLALTPDVLTAPTTKPLHGSSAQDTLHVSDTYFLVAHFHHVLFGTVVFTIFGGFYFWWPKFTGKKPGETLGKWHFWTLFISRACHGARPTTPTSPATSPH